MVADVTKKLFARSDRVKGVDFHPTEPWIIAALYNGSVTIYNYDSGAVVKTFEVAEVPVRCVRFIARKNWFVAGADDFQLRVFNYNTHEKVAAFEAHPDYIRCLTVHPTAPIVLTGSDDMSIKAWDWDKNWKNVITYEGHTHYIMNLVFNPKDPNTFASACLDRTVKMWSLTSPNPNFTMEAHEKGVNYVDFYPGADKPYLVTCGDDKTVKIWDYLSKSCVQTMDGHTNNVSFAVFHPNLPVIISGSEDGTVKIWNANTYRIENTLSYALERSWCVSLRKDANEVAIGFDEGLISLKLGRDEPTYSLDSSGKLVYTKNHAVYSTNLQLVPEDYYTSPSTNDGSVVPLSMKEIGTTEVFPTSVQHSPNGRFVTVVGDGEHITYTALAWRNKSFGQGISFAWGPDSNTYAVLETRLKPKLFKNFKERPGTGLKAAGAFALEALYPGPLLAGRGSGFVIFWDWETGEIVRRIDVDAKNVFWSGTGSLVCISSDDSFYVLRFDRDAYNEHLESGAEVDDEGVESAFDLVAEVSDKITTAKWVGDCLLYTTPSKLAYFVGFETYTISPLDAASPVYILGYFPAHSRVYLLNKSFAVVSYVLSLTYVEYQTAVLRGDMDGAAALLEELKANASETGGGKEMVNKAARFLEARGYKELALATTLDDDHKFDLALSLDDLETALSVLSSTPTSATPDSPPPETDSSTLHKWKLLGDKALSIWRFELAKEAFTRSNDLSALFLLLLSTGDRQGLQDLAQKAEEKGLNNLAFAARLQLCGGDGGKGREDCVRLLVSTGRAPEAALFARTYAPCLVPTAVQAWKSDLTTKGRKKLAEGISDPSTDPDAFSEGWEAAVQREEEMNPVPALIEV